MYVQPLDEIGYEDASCARETARTMLAAALPVLEREIRAKIADEAREHILREIRACERAGDKAGSGLLYRDEVVRLLRRMADDVHLLGGSR